MKCEGIKCGMEEARSGNVFMKGKFDAMGVRETKMKPMAVKE